MITIPFIYFLLLLIYLLVKNKRFDIAAFIVSLYVVTSFFSILIDIFNLRPRELVNYNIGFFPALLYCTLITFTILPFIKYSSINLPNIELKNNFLFKFIIYLYFTIFIVTITMGISDIINILNGDIGSLRRAVNDGEMKYSFDFSGPFYPIFLLFGMLGSLSVFMLIPFFYSLRFLKKSIWFNLIILCSSFPILIAGILGVDRSKFVIWLLSFAFLLVLFYKDLGNNQKRFLKRITFIIVGFFITYFSVVTISRFGDRSSFSSVTGAQGSVITYLGQSYLYFCYFLENIEHNYLSLQRICPLTYKLFVNNGLDGPVLLNESILRKTGILVSVFPTFIGDIITDSGFFVALLFCIILYLITQKTLRRIKQESLSFSFLIHYFALGLIPTFGIFIYIYDSFSKTFTLLFWLIIALFFNKKFKW